MLCQPNQTPWSNHLFQVTYKIAIRYLNAAQNKLERLPSPSDAFEDEVDSKGRKIKKRSKNRPEVYSAPVLQEVYLQVSYLSPKGFPVLKGSFTVRSRIICTTDVRVNQCGARR